MPRIRLLAISFGTGLFLAAPALAANGETTGPATMYGGPGFDYEQVTDVPAGTRLINHGCVNVEEWCRVRWGKHRGWVAGEFLAQVHAKGATLVALFPQPAATDGFEELEDEIIYGGAGYAVEADDGKKFKKFRRGKHEADRGKNFRHGKHGVKHADFRDSRRFLKLKPRGFLKLKPRGFLKIGGFH